MREDYHLDAIITGMRSGLGRGLSIPLVAIIAYYLARICVDPDCDAWCDWAVFSGSIWGLPLLFVQFFVFLVHPYQIVFVFLYLGALINLLWTEDHVLEAWFILCVVNWVWTLVFLSAEHEWHDPIRIFRIAAILVVFALTYGLLRFGPGLWDMYKQRKQPSESPPPDESP